jgi:hypothetical protein
VLVRVAPRLFSLKPGAARRDSAPAAWSAAPEPASFDAGDEYALLSGLVRAKKAGWCSCGHKS